MTELREFLLAPKGLLDDKNSDFVNDLIHDWDERILSKLLIDFNKEELAQKIDAINPNQSKYNISKEIYQAFFPKEDDNSSYDYCSYDDSNNPFFDNLLGTPYGL